MQTRPADVEQILREALRSHGQRYTPQRAAVYEVLAASRSHPNAEDVYNTVREASPGISLATVYKSLEALVGCGLAIKLASADGSARYDGQMEPHHHAHCDACGRVFDVPAGPERTALDALMAGVEGFVVREVRVHLSGRCRDCTAAEGVASAGRGSTGAQGA